MKKYIALILAGLMLCTLLLSACNKGDEPKNPDPGSPTQPSQDPEGSKGGNKRDNLIIAVGADIYSMDPQLKKDVPSGRIKTLVFETLVNVDENNNIVPGLAKSWEIVDDTTIRFTLQDNVTFHNGEPLTVDDILYSFERGKDAPQTSANMEPIDIANCKAIDEKTFEMKLKYPYGAIMLNLTDNCCGIVNKKYVTEVGDDEFALKPIGTGPYTFDNWVSGDRTELSRYDNYWGNKPYFKNITFRVITEATNRAIELETGGADICIDVAPADVSRIEGNDKLKMERGPNYSVTYMAMNTSKKPFDNVKVRQAVTMALDLPSIVDAVYEGTGSVGRGPLTSSVWGFDESIQPAAQDIEKAKQLLSEAGYPDGFTTTILTSDQQQRINFCEIAQNQLSQIGITCEVKIMEWGAYLDAVFAGEHEMTVLGYSYGLDPGVGLYNLFDTECFGADGNISWYSNDQVDSLIDQAKTEMDEDKRMDMYKQVQQIVNEEAPWVFIWQGENLNGITKDLKGFVNRGDSLYRFMDMYFE